MHSVEPWSYLRDLLCLLPRWPSKRVLELAPAYWRETADKKDTQERLVANPFRSVTAMKLEAHGRDCTEP